MSYYIIIRGPMGSGKTTIAQALAGKIPASVFHIDAILDEAGLDTIPPGAPCIPAENFIKTQNNIIHPIQKLLDSGTIVIIDGCFYHEQAIDHLQQSLQSKGYIFTLTLPIELCIQRDSQRSVSYGESAVRDVHDLVSKLNTGIPIDASGSIEDTIKRILQYDCSL